MYYSVISVIPQNDYHLLLRFETGEEKLFNMKPYLSVGIFKALQEPSVFNTAHLSFDTVAWNNGADIDPETLYADSVLLEDEALAKAMNEGRTGECIDAVAFIEKIRQDIFSNNDDNNQNLV